MPTINCSERSCGKALWRLAGTAQFACSIREEFPLYPAVACALGQLTNQHMAHNLRQRAQSTENGSSMSSWFRGGETLTQKSDKARVGSATRTAFTTATKSMISCRIAPSSGGRYPAAAATMPTMLAAIPPTALCSAIERMR